MKSLAAEPKMLEDAADVDQAAPMTRRLSWRVGVGGSLTGWAERLRTVGGGFRSICSALALLAEAVAVGLMKPSDVEALVARTYQSRPDFYDPKRYDLPYEKGMLPTLREIKPAGRLLDAFCGQGREARLFAEAGYCVTAVDQLDWMIDAAIQYASTEGFDAEFEVGDFAQMAVSNPFDVVYTSCWMYSTVQGRRNRQTFLAQCHRLCHQDGIIVISHLTQTVEGRGGAWLRHLVAKVTALLTFGNLSTEFGERIYTGLFWHHLGKATVENEIREAGLRVVNRIEGQGMEPTFLFLSPQGNNVAETSEAG
ncbi:MAG: class I SAM-dependent methyltransferase [Planctomycetota bacterium]